jgi:hypothetical protein
MGLLGNLLVREGKDFKRCLDEILDHSFVRYSTEATTCSPWFNP